MEDFIFSGRGDKMKLRTAPKAGPNGFSIISMGSILWRDAFGKMSGTFERVRERKR